MQTLKWWRYKITPKTLKKVFIEMFRLYPILCNLYILSLCIEWWFGFDKISKYIYPLIGDCYYIILLFFVGSLVFKFCGIYRFYLVNMALWLSFEVLTLHDFIVPHFLIILSFSTLLLFLATILNALYKWKKKNATT